MATQVVAGTITAAAHVDVPTTAVPVRRVPSIPLAAVHVLRKLPRAAHAVPTRPTVRVPPVAIASVADADSQLISRYS